MISKQDIIIIQTLLSRCNLRAQKTVLLQGFSDGRAEHVNELSSAQAGEFIRFLRRRQQAIERQRADPRAASIDRMKGKILSMAHEMNWRLPTGKIDMKTVNGWCRKYGYMHKPLDDYEYAELPALITQFEKMYIQFIKRK